MWVGRKVFVNEVSSLANFTHQFIQNFREHVKLTFKKSSQGTEANGSWQLDPHHIRMGLSGTWADKSQKD